MTVRRCCLSERPTHADNCNTCTVDAECDQDECRHSEDSSYRIPGGHDLSTSLISLRGFFHSFAFLVSFGYPGYLNAGMVRTIFKVDRTASQIISRN